jgi:hypothetical protein
VTIAGMNYLRPVDRALVRAFASDVNLAHELARDSVDFFIAFNDALRGAYDAAGVP